MLILQSSAAFHIVFLMVDSGDHLTGKTGLTPTVTISKNGGSFASPSGAITEIANGWYKLAGNATDTGTLGQLILHATGSGADTTDMIVGEVVAFNPQDAAALGLSRVDAAVSSRMATFTLPTNFSSLVIDSTGRVNAFLIGILTTVFTEGATGRIAAAFKQFFNIASPAATMDHGVLVDTVTTYTGNTPQTGDAFARIGAAGAGLTALGDTRIANLDATVSSRLASGSYTTPPTAVAIRTEMDSNSTKLANLDATISSRTKPADTQAAVTNLTNAPTAGDFTAAMKTSLNAATPAVTVSDKTGFSLSTAGILAIWHQLTSAIVTAGTIGKLLVDNVNATISSRAATGDAMTLTSGERTSIGTAVWATTVRSLSTFGTLVADITTAVWAAAARTLTAFSFTVDTNANATETAIKAQTDNLPNVPFVHTSGKVWALDGDGNPIANEAAVDAIDAKIGTPSDYGSGATLADNFYDSVTIEQDIQTKADELWQLQGLDIANPMTVTETTRVAGAIELGLTGDEETTTTVTRQP